MELKNKYNLIKLAKATNIVEMLDTNDISVIGESCHRGFELDLQSRYDWEERNASSMKLALQVVEKKSFPWPGASSVKFPLVTIAALQWHSRSYPLLIPSTDVVKMRVTTDDPQGLIAAKAKRVGQHMSYQILEEDEDWEEEMDKVLIHTPIVGCSFKKTYHDSIRGRNVSQFIPASSLVVNYYAKSLDSAQRVSHILQLSTNDIYERVTAGHYVKTDVTHRPSLQLSDTQIARDKAQGLTQPATDPDTPVEVIEQHTYLDLDGDGYQEPYIVTFRRTNHEVLRIEARFLSTSIVYKEKGVVQTIKAEQFFTKFPFIPSPDGGFYDLGFGALLGPVNESINTLINQLIDAGTMATTAGGFLSRGIKLRSGNSPFLPLEWKHVDTTGDDLRKGIMPLPVREPSQVLFTLLSLLIGYGEKIGMATDILTGENVGQNTPAQTAQTMTEQGLKIFNGIFKRTYRSLRDEFRKIYRLNRLYLPDTVRYGENKIVLAQDYFGDAAEIVPVADPNATSEHQHMIQASMVKAAAQTTPGYNKYKVERNWLEAMKILNIDEIFPNPEGPNAVPAPPNPKMLEIQIKDKLATTKQQDVQGKLQVKAAELMGKAEKARAEIEKLNAQTVVLMKEAQSVDTKHQIELIKIMAQHQQATIDDSHEAARLLLDTVSAFKPEPKVDVPGGAPARPAK